MPASANEPLRFGRVVISPAERTVSVEGRAVGVGARAFDVLLALAQRRERLVTREELLDLVWPGVVVEEHNITAQISTLRKLIGPQVIATVPGRGYRFVAGADEPAQAPRAETAPAAPPRHNLPEQRTRFIGREAALADIGRLVAQTRLLTLTGIGGSGKTRLALEFARRRLADHPDGAWFVDLAPLTAPGRVAFALAAAVGMGDDPEEPLAERLAAHLAERQALVVLDNCEHVRAEVAQLVDALLARPGLTRVVATSREPLAVAGEQLYPVRPLSLPATDALEGVGEAEAVRMFVDRARLGVPGFDLGAGNAAAVAQICRRLDGIALAIELAAARVPVLSVFDLLQRLDDGFRLLGRGNAPLARQQTLAATMQWSYDLLGPDEQRMLARLAVFRGGCTLAAAAAVAQTIDEYEALERLTALYDRSLLVVDRGVDADSPPRYRLLETVRQYARERLDEAGDAQAALARHAQHFLAFAETAGPQLDGPQASLSMKRLHAEHENLAAAMGWCTQQGSGADPSWGLRLAAATLDYWLFNEVELGCRLALAALRGAPEEDNSPARFQTLRGLAGMYMHRGQGEAGLPHARAALALARRIGHVEWQAMALNSVGTCLSRSGDEDGALRHFEQARRLAQSAGSAAALSAVLNNIAAADFCHGRIERAAAGLRQALHLARAQGNVRSVLIVLHNLVRVQVAANAPDDAHRFAAEAERLLREVGEDVLKLELLEVCGGLASVRGQHALAARFWGYACQRFVDEGYRRPPEDEGQLQRLLAASRQVLGDEAFERAEAAGRALDLDTAMRELGHWLATSSPADESSRRA